MCVRSLCCVCVCVCVWTGMDMEVRGCVAIWLYEGAEMSVGRATSRISTTILSSGHVVNKSRRPPPYTIVEQFPVFPWYPNPPPPPMPSGLSAGAHLEPLVGFVERMEIEQPRLLVGLGGGQAEHLRVGVRGERVC